MITKIVHSFFFKPTSLILAVSLLLISFKSPQTKLLLKSGTPCQVQINQDISSENFTTGQVFSCRVVSDVKVEGKTVISAGAAARGQVVIATKARGLGREGSITLSVKSLQAVDGQEVLINSNVLSRAGDNRELIAWGCAIGGCVGSILIYPLVLSPLMLLIKGKNATFPSGTIFDSTIATNVEILID
jgi:hypothetical protein